jgi:hypothetical protein
MTSASGRISHANTLRVHICCADGSELGPKVSPVDVVAVMDQTPYRTPLANSVAERVVRVSSGPFARSVSRVGYFSKLLLSGSYSKQPPRLCQVAFNGRARDVPSTDGSENRLRSKDPSMSGVKSRNAAGQPELRLGCLWLSVPYLADVGERKRT